MEVPVISVIDDDASIRAAADNFLSSHGYAVHTFATAEDFLRSVHLGTSSCIIADVQMPGMSGLDLLELVRSQGNNTPYIVITAFLNESVRARTVKARADGLLEKPFLASALINYIKMALKRDPNISDQ